MSEALLISLIGNLVIVGGWMFQSYLNSRQDRARSLKEFAIRTAESEIQEIHSRLDKYVKRYMDATRVLSSSLPVEPSRLPDFYEMLSLKAMLPEADDEMHTVLRALHKMADLKLAGKPDTNLGSNMYNLLDEVTNVALKVIEQKRTNAHAK